MLSASRSGELALAPFADLAGAGANAWWRYVVAILCVLGGGMISVAAVAIGLMQFGWSGVLAELTVPELLSKQDFLARLVAFLFLVWGIVAFLPWMRVFLPWLHRRPWRTFLTSAPAFRWGLAARSFLVMVGLSAAGLAIQLALGPDSVSIRAPNLNYLVMAILGIALLPFQVLAEETFFRGYLFQLTGRLTRWVVLRVGIPATLFTLAHMGNPEATHDFAWSMAIYASAALYLGVLAYRTNGLEASAGFHLATNLFVLLIASPSVSVFPVDALVADLDTDFRASFFAALLTFLLHYYLLSRFGRREHSRAS